MCVRQSKKGLLPPSGEKPGTLVRQSIHQLKPVKMSKGVRDLRCNRNVMLPKETHYIFTLITKTSGCVIGVGIDSGLDAHWNLHWVMESVRARYMGDGESSLIHGM